MFRRIFLIFAALVVAVVAAIFASLNPEVIPLDLAFGEIKASLTLVIVASLALGWLLGLISASVLIFRMMAQRRSLRRSVQLAEKEIENLRSLPDTDSAVTMSGRENNSNG